MRLTNHSVIGALVAFSALAFVPAVSAQGQFEVGSHIDASPYGPDFFGATITGTVQGGYVVKMDGDDFFQAGQEFVVPANRIRALTAHPKKGGNAPAAGAGTGASTGNASMTSAASSTTATTGGTNAAASTTSTANPSPTSPGKGKPPDGIYTCMLWTNHQMIVLGKLEIRGNQYKGLNAQAAFHNFTLSANGQMVLSSGLSGLPDGFKLTGVNWIGGDSRGRPLIKIWYTGPSGWRDVIDAVKEK